MLRTVKIHIASDAPVNNVYTFDGEIEFIKCDSTDWHQRKKHE